MPKASPMKRQERELPYWQLNERSVKDRVRAAAGSFRWCYEDYNRMTRNKRLRTENHLEYLGLLDKIDYLLGRAEGLHTKAANNKEAWAMPLTFQPEPESDDGDERMLLSFHEGAHYAKWKGRKVPLDAVPEKTLRAIRRDLFEEGTEHATRVEPDGWEGLEATLNQLIDTAKERGMGE